MQAAEPTVAEGMGICGHRALPSLLSLEMRARGLFADWPDAIPPPRCFPGQG